MSAFTRFMDNIMKAVSWFLIGVLAVMSVTVFLSVLGRYVLGSSISLSDPLARYGQIWIMLLGSALVLRKGLHIGMSNLVDKLPPKYRQIVLKFDVLLILVFSATMIWQGIRLIGIAENQIIPEMGIPMAIVYCMIPVSGVLLVLCCVEMLFRRSIDSLTASEE